MPDEELFSPESVKIEIPARDMPGRPLKRVKCDRCGEYVQDKREVNLNGKLLCKACAKGAYYKIVKE